MCNMYGVMKTHGLVDSLVGSSTFEVIHLGMELQFGEVGQSMAYGASLWRFSTALITRFVIDLHSRSVILVYT